MPNEQAREFNRYIDLMNVANLEFRTFIGVLDQMVDKLELRLCWLVTLHLWAEQIKEIGQAVRVAVREPTTASAYEGLVDRNRKEWVPLTDLAALLAGERQDWSPEELEPGSDPGTQDVTDAAWEGAVAREEATLEREVGAGMLESKGRGRRLAIRSGSFNQHFGRADAAVPELLLRFRVQPEAERDEVEGERRLLDRLYAALDWHLEVADEVSVRERLTKHVGSSTALGHRECVLQCEAIQQVINEIAAQFEGTDPLKPDARKKLERCGSRLAVLKDELAYVGVDVGEPEQDEELLDLLRSVVRRDRA